MASMAIDAWRASLIIETWRDSLAIDAWIIETWRDMQNSNTERQRSGPAIEAWRASFKLIVIETWEWPA